MSPAKTGKSLRPLEVKYTSLSCSNLATSIDLVWHAPKNFLFHLNQHDLEGGSTTIYMHEIWDCSHYWRLVITIRPLRQLALDHVVLQKFFQPLKSSFKGIPGWLGLVRSVCHDMNQANMQDFVSEMQGQLLCLVDPRMMKEIDLTIFLSQASWGKRTVNSTESWSSGLFFPIRFMPHLHCDGICLSCEPWAFPQEEHIYTNSTHIRPAQSLKWDLGWLTPSFCTPSILTRSTLLTSFVGILPPA